MIVVRISKVTGSCKIDGYNDWFPVESVNLGGGEFTELNISKKIDSATCDLMFFAMKDRGKTQASDGEVRTADVHFLQLGTGAKSGKGEPYLRVHVGNVLIQNWCLTSFGDDRPGESLSLWFDQVAIQYHSTTDGKTFNLAGKKGWDQKKNDPWTPGTKFFP